MSDSAVLGGRNQSLETRIDAAGWQLEERKEEQPAGSFQCVCVGERRAAGMAVLAGMCCHLSLWEDICASPPAPRGLCVNLEMGRMMSVLRTSAPRLTTPNA